MFQRQRFGHCSEQVRNKAERSLCLFQGCLRGLGGSLDSMECEVSHGVFFHLGLIDPEFDPELG